MQFRALFLAVVGAGLGAAACDDTAAGGGADAAPQGPGNTRDAMAGGTEFPIGGSIGEGGTGDGGAQGGTEEGGNGQGGDGQGGAGGKPEGGSGGDGPGGNGQGGDGGNGQGGNAQGGEGGNGRGGDGGSGQGGFETGGVIPGDPCDEVACDFGELCDPRTGRCVPNVADPCDDVVCAGDEHCEDGICLPDQVNPDEGIAHGCETPEECPEGFCLDEAASEGGFPGGFCIVQCASDADCAGGICTQADVDLFICIAACGRQDDCREGWVCLSDPEAPSDYCVPDCRVTGCGPDGVCDQETGACGAGGLGCRNDADCGAGEACDPEVGQCVPVDLGCRRNADCGAGEVCDLEFGVCQPAGCQVDADCGRDELCNQRTGECIPSVECATDDDCGFGAVCAEGVCAANPELCQDDADCARGELCDFATGQCVADGGFCELDEDCAADELCNPRLGVCEPLNPDPSGRLEPCAGPDDCGADLVCVQFAPDQNFCLGLCDASAAIDGCLPHEGCYAPDQAIPGEAFCIPGNDCAAGTATDVCGAPASCFSIGHATFCATPGAAGVGEPCDLIAPDGESCQENLTCEFGACREACDAQGECAAGQSCQDFSDQVDGVPYSFCFGSCDVFTQDGCGAGEACGISAFNGGAILGECLPEANGDRDIGELCEAAEATYWGDCNAGSLCGTIFQGEPDTCIGFCDVTDASQCAGGQACYFGLFGEGAEALGLCIGECEVFTGAGCGAGSVCAFSGDFGPSANADEAPIGFCSPGTGLLSAGDDCEFDEVVGGSDCEVGTVCVDVIGNGQPTCQAVCEAVANSPHPCAAGEECAVGLGADAIGLGGSERIGLCVPVE